MQEKKKALRAASATLNANAARCSLMRAQIVVEGQWVEIRMSHHTQCGTPMWSPQALNAFSAHLQNDKLTAA